MKDPRWVTCEEIQLIRARGIERFGGSHGVLDLNAVESSLARPQNLWAYGDKNVDVAYLAAAYLCGFAQNQGFVDGNKRIGLGATLVFLRLNGYRLDVPDTDLYALVMAVGRNEVTEAQAAVWLRQRITPR